MSEFGDGIRLGFDKETGEIIRWAGRNGRINGNLLLVGPTGEGKTTDVLLAAAREAMERWSVILVEPKAALCAMLYRAAKELGRVEILSPFEDELPISLPASSSCYNGMAPLDPKKRGYTTGCERLAGLISEEGTNATNENAAHFKDRARETIAGTIMEVGESPIFAGERHLSTVRDVMTSSNGENFWEFCEAAVERGNRYVCQKLAFLTEAGAKESKEVMDVLATARRYTSFIGNECIGPNLSLDGFRFASLKEEKTTVFISLPAPQLANPAPAKWLRLVIDCALHELWSSRPGKYPVLLIMDEFCQYGALPSIRSAMNLARGFGLTLWPVVQSLGDLKTTYGPAGWETFVSSAAVKIFFNAECLTTRKVVSELSGIKTVKVPNYSFGSSTPGIGWPPKVPTTSNSEGISISEVARPVMHPHEVGNIPPDEMVMRVRGIDNIIRCKRKPYWRCSDLDGLYDPDQYEEEK